MGGFLLPYAWVNIRSTNGPKPRANGLLDGRIILVERLGSTTVVYVDTAAGQFVIESRSGSYIALDQTVGLHLATEHLHFFSPDGGTL